MINKFLSNSEKGRTLVEMIGVIALIGFISVIGFSGYNFTLDHNRANGISDALYKANTLLATKQIRTNAQLGDFLKKTDVKTYLKSITNDNDGIRIIVTLSQIDVTTCASLTTAFPGSLEIIGNTCQNNQGVKIWLTNMNLADYYRTDPTGNPSTPNITSCADDEMLGTDNVCYTCHDEGDLPILPEDCDTCFLREMQNNKCVYKD